MDSLSHLVHDALAWKVIVGYWIFSSMTTALPLPDGNGPKSYQFLYAFLHSLAGNVDRAASAFHLPKS